MNDLSHAADGLDPAEWLLDLLAVPLVQDVTGMAAGSAVDGGMPDLLCNIRCDDHPSELGCGVNSVLSLVRPKRQSPRRAGGVSIDHLKRRLALAGVIDVSQVCLHDEPVAILHQRMLHEAQHRRRAGRLFLDPGIGDRGLGMGGVRASLAAEGHCGVAGLADPITTTGNAGAGKRRRPPPITTP